MAGVDIAIICLVIMFGLASICAIICNCVKECKQLNYLMEYEDKEVNNDRN